MIQIPSNVVRPVPASVTGIVGIMIIYGAGLGLPGLGVETPAPEPGLMRQVGDIRLWND